ncbi:MAG: hypothetical protein IPH28_01845 [Cytophagaceae bacterium]|nr:hypothetical protein [Cytophagaceae bacterium]
MFNDLFGEGTGIIISFGLFNDCPNISNYKKLFGEFSKVLTINLKEERPEDFFDEDNALFDIYIKTENWKNGKIDVALKVIANDEIRAMFICPSKKCIIAPYDGGVDVIVDNTEKRNRLKRKYRDWLSKRKDGM